MNVSEWIKTRISQIASLSEYDGGGEDTKKIDSNEEFSCLARLLANCETLDDKKFVKDKMKEYLDGAEKNHFEGEDGTSYDEIYDNTGNRMYVGYDQKGNIDHIDTTAKDKSGKEHSALRISFNKDESIFIQDKRTPKPIN